MSTTPSPTKRTSSMRSPSRSPVRSALSPKTSNIALPFKKSAVINPFTRQLPLKQQTQPKKPVLGFTIYEDKVPKEQAEIDHPESNRPNHVDQENILQPRAVISRPARLPLRNLSIVDYPAELHIQGQRRQLEDVFEHTSTREETPLYTNVPSFVTPSRRLCRYIVRSGSMEEEEEILVSKVRKPAHKRSLSTSRLRSLVA